MNAKHKLSLVVVVFYISLAESPKRILALEDRIDTILAHMSVQEKIEQLYYKTDGNERLGITAVIDYDNYITETDEVNNRCRSRLTVPDGKVVSSKHVVSGPRAGIALKVDLALPQNEKDPTSVSWHAEAGLDAICGGTLG